MSFTRRTSQEIKKNTDYLGEEAVFYSPDGKRVVLHVVGIIENPAISCRDDDGNNYTFVIGSRIFEGLNWTGTKRSGSAL